MTIIFSNITIYLKFRLDLSAFKVSAVTARLIHIYTHHFCDHS